MDAITTKPIITEVLDVESRCRVFAIGIDGDGWFSPLAAISVDEVRNSVEVIVVEAEYRGQGWAVRLLAYARERTGLSLDRAFGDFSAAGFAWCRANGIKTDRRKATHRDAEGEAWGARLFGAIIRYGRPETKA